eukprot:6010330-Pleurochrysis_carterae.AAC.1
MFVQIRRFMFGLVSRIARGYSGCVVRRLSGDAVIGRAAAHRWRSGCMRFVRFDGCLFCDGDSGGDGVGYDHV